MVVVLVLVRDLLLLMLVFVVRCCGLLFVVAFGCVELLLCCG